MAAKALHITSDAQTAIFNGEYNGKPTISVGYQGGRFPDFLNGGQRKWRRLFEKDADGDIALIEVIRYLKKNTSEEVFEEIKTNIDDFVQKLQELT